MKKTFIRCSRLFPHERNCRNCSHKKCSLRDLNNPYNADSHEDKAITEYNEDQMEFAELAQVNE